MAIKHLINGIVPFCNRFFPISNIGFEMNVFDKGKHIWKVIAFTRGKLSKIYKIRQVIKSLPKQVRVNIPRHSSILHNYQWFNNSSLINNMKQIADTRQNTRNGNNRYVSFGGLLGIALNNQEEYDKAQVYYDFHSKMKEALPDLLNKNFENVFKDSNLCLDTFEFGPLLAKGCYGVVHTVKINTKGQQKGSDSPSKDLAIKMMFNYHLNSMSSTILKGMQREMLPLASENISDNDDDLKYWKEQRFSLPSHPNIVEIYGAFSERFKILPDSEKYSEALPISHQGYGHNYTLYLVMKKYDMTLQEYLERYSPSFHTSLLIFTQLTEALVFLHQNNVAHRDIKPNNILLDVSQGVQDPQVVVADFGNALVRKGLKVSRRENGGVQSKGGNPFYMAPEIHRPQGEFLDYNRSDLWALAAIASEIFQVENFASFNFKIPTILSYLIQSCLNIDPLQRPSPALVANICQILLFYPEFNPNLDCNRHFAATFWLSSLSASVKHHKFQSGKSKLSEENLKLTFLKRVQLQEVLEAMEYMSHHASWQ